MPRSTPNYEAQDWIRTYVLQYWDDHETGPSLDEIQDAYNAVHEVKGGRGLFQYNVDKMIEKGVLSREEGKFRSLKVIL